MESPRRIGIFLDCWDMGGLAGFCQFLANGLQDSGYEVTVLLGRRYRSRAPAEVAFFRQMLRAKKFRVIDLRLHKVKRMEQNAHLLYQLRKLNLDLLIPNQFSNYLPAFNAISAEVRLISIGCGDHGQSYDEFVAAQYFVHRHVVVSRQILETFSGLCPPDWRDRIVLCHPGAPLDEERKPYVPEGPLRVAYYGRFDFIDKRLQDLPVLWKNYLQKGGYGRLTLIGDGEARRWLQRQFQLESDVGTVVFTERLYGEELFAALGGQEIILSLSNWDGFGLALIEALLAGCYPVLSDTRSIHHEIIQELQGGMLCPVGDTNAFADVLLRCDAIRPGLLIERENIRRRAAQKFGMEQMIQTYDALIRIVLEEPLNEPASHLGVPPARKAGFWHRLFQMHPRAIKL